MGSGFRMTGLEFRITYWFLVGNIWEENPYILYTLIPYQELVRLGVGFQVQNLQVDFGVQSSRLVLCR